MLAPLKKLSLFIAVLLLIGCDQVFETVYCDYGQGGIENQFFETGVNLLNECLLLNHLTDQQQAKYLQTRAWAHYNLQNNELALDDQQTAFQLQPPTQHYEYINHAAYLRRMQRYTESLLPLKKAQKLDKTVGVPNMMTQYNLGWSLYELGRYEEAIEAFNKGIPQQPDYPFVYLRRGLAFYQQGKQKSAQEDFSEFLLLIGDQEVNLPVELKKDIEILPSAYGEIRNL
ncbi:MAG: tetratricopeptide repeat protein [Gammaproteobacteria bacterium]|nr:tetratricopeptide repeat protein [Gammaproteobacteria bacterium]